MSIAAYLAPPPRPPHDPFWLRLDPGTGWRLSDIPADALPPLAIHGPSGALVLPFEPGTARVLGEESGSLGGLALPGTMAIDGAGRLWLLDRKRRKLRRFDPCACAFRDVPCQSLALGDPRSIAADRSRIYVVDAAAPGRLLVLDANALTLRAIWAPPRTAVLAPWQPTAVAVAHGQVHVADAANGVIHRFAAWGSWLGHWAGSGTVSRLAADCEGRLYAVVPGREDVDVYEGGAITGRLADPSAVTDRFSPAPIPVARSGAFDLSGWCAGAGWFGLDGEPLAAPPETADSYVPAAATVTEALDSGIARCQWHRIVLDAAIPPHGGISIATTTAETPLSDAMIAALPATAWQAVPLSSSAREALVFSGPGRYLWMRVILTGDGLASPALTRVDMEYPRISLRRYLPAAMGADPISANFLDRFLGIFDRGLRDIEARVDNQAELFDPRITPATPGRDMLAWLAGWIGVTLDRRWPEARRRRMVRAAASLFACRGTADGLRGALLLWLGWDRLQGLLQPAARCGPGCAQASPCPPLPRLVLEHWKLRRWLFLGGSRLGDATQLWGAKLLGRSQLGVTAQAGITRLDATRDPLRDPFHIQAHQASVFVPAHAVARAEGRASLARLLRDQVPAHVKLNVVPVEPRMRVGIQASLGFDSVIGCWPPTLRGTATTLGEIQLGRATVLSGPAGTGTTMPPRLGHDSRLRPGAPSRTDFPKGDTR